MLSDAQATTKAIKEQLIWLFRVATPDDGVVLHFASHGIGRSLTTTEVNYIVTYDTEMGSRDALYATALPLVDIVAFIRRTPSERVLLVLDVGNARMPWLPVGSEQITSNAPTDTAVERGHVALLSSSPGEHAYESSRHENSFLMHFLLEGMKSAHGNISSLELFNYVSARVSSVVQQDFQRPQHPALTMAGAETRFELGQAVG